MSHQAPDRHLAGGDGFPAAVGAADHQAKVVIDGLGEGGDLGIPPEQQAHLFDGYLEKLRMPPPPQGLGLGLPLCQAIARGHGGRLLLQSGPEGTTVTVSLPDRRCTKTVLREPPFAYGGGFHPVLLGLADALPYTAFTRKNLD